LVPFFIFRFSVLFMAPHIQIILEIYLKKWICRNRQLLREMA